MYLKIAKRPKGSYLTIVEKYWDKKSKSPKEKTAKVIGYFDPDSIDYDDIISRYKLEAAQMTMEHKENSFKNITINLNEVLPSNYDDSKNIGYVVFKYIYKELELDKFWKIISSKYEIEYDLDKIFQLMVFSRILFPASKKKTFENRYNFFESFDDFELEDVYRSLDILGEHEEELQKWIYDHSVTKYHRDLSATFFDCTNYYYDISKPDMDDLDDDGNLILKRYRKYGPEKNHRKDPIVELGLLMDNTGIPLAYDLFPGNESEKIHMLPIINRARNQYGFGRTIVVADRGLNTSDNIFMLNGKNNTEHNPRDGYIYGQSVRGADKEFKEWVLKQDEYKNTKIEENDTDDETSMNGIFRHKSRIYPKKIYITREKNDASTVKQSITVDQKQMVYYSEKYKKKQKLERDRAVERAVDLIAHPKKYDQVSAKGASGYVMNLAYTQDGEIINKNLALDTDKIAEEEKYDGYYSIVTSELKMDDIEIREKYRGLIRIEDTFKITKSEFDTRPIYVRTNEHIDGHFTTCFTALVLIRLLQVKLENKYTVGKLLTSLKKYNCVHLDKNNYQFVYNDEIIISISKSFNINLSAKYKTSNEIRRLLKY